MSLPENFITVLPPPSSWKVEEVDNYLKWAFKLREKVKGAFLIPEVLPHAGYGERPIPFQEKIPLLEFASLLGKGGKVFVSRYFSTIQREEAARWLDDAGSSVDGVLVVGKTPGSTRAFGMDVLEAITLAKRYFEDVGAILIAGRPDETVRVCRKIETGATFFVSQITFDPLPLEVLLSALEKTCPSITVYPSVAPIVGKREVELLEWMGVAVPDPIPSVGKLIGRLLKLPLVGGMNYEHILLGNLRKLAYMDIPPYNTLHDLG
ncbi:MAG: hypothetical protein GXO39_00020 [Thermotogae bacterium]|nr:hypothetical protein [Thermotogota bacterium]